LLKKAVGLTDSEWKIMLLLWENAPRTITQIEHLLKEETGWSKHTVISFLKRMLKKGAIYAKESQPARLYYPNRNKDEVVREETHSFLGKLYGGNIGLMVSSIVEQEKLSDEEIDGLMDMLRASKGKRGGEEK
jgi:BlaI family penicillinase repressor